MTVEDLINKLKKFNMDDKVEIKYADEDGFKNYDTIENVESPWAGLVLITNEPRN